MCTTATPSDDYSSLSIQPILENNTDKAAGLHSPLIITDHKPRNLAIIQDDNLDYHQTSPRIGKSSKRRKSSSRPPATQRNRTTTTSSSLSHQPIKTSEQKHEQNRTEVRFSRFQHAIRHIICTEEHCKETRFTVRADLISTQQWSLVVSIKHLKQIVTLEYELASFRLINRYCSEVERIANRIGLTCEIGAMEFKMGHVGSPVPEGAEPILSPRITHSLCVGEYQITRNNTEGVASA